MKHDSMIRLFGALIALLVAIAQCLGADILVANLGSGEITAVNTDTGAKTKFSDGYNQPFGLAQHPVTREVYVISYGDGKVTKVSSGGQKTTVASGLPKPVGAAFSPSGELFVACYSTGNLNAGSVVKISPDGTKTTLASRLTAPVDIAIDSGGDLLVSSYGGTGGASVYRITQSGAVISFISYGTFYLPHGIVSMGTDLYVAENGKGRIQIKAGSAPPAVWVQSPLLTSVIGIAQGGGSWYAANMNQGILVKITPQLAGPPVVSELARDFRYPTAVLFRQ